METGNKVSKLQRGLTLIECCIVLAIISILVGSAAPAFMDSRKKVVLDGTASEVRNDIQYARSLAVARNEGVRISFPAAGDGSTCMVIHTGAAADCTCAPSGLPQCVAGTEVFKTQGFGAGATVRVAANVASMRVEPVRGTVTPTGTVRVISGTQGEVQHVVNIMGRTRTCSPNGQIAGYKPC
jgi:type IV fimbrial biogenesis protein FimT